MNRLTSCESLAATGRLPYFDFFILSDSTDPDIWIAEEAAFLALRARTGGEQRIFYRRRPKNIDRKAGNIAEWVQAHYIPQTVDRVLIYDLTQPPHDS